MRLRLCLFRFLLLELQLPLLLWLYGNHLRVPSLMGLLHYWLGLRHFHLDWLRNCFLHLLNLLFLIRLSSHFLILDLLLRYLRCFMMLLVLLLLLLP